MSNDTQNIIRSPRSFVASGMPAQQLLACLPSTLRLQCKAFAAMIRSLTSVYKRSPSTLADMCQCCSIQHDTARHKCRRAMNKQHLQHSASRRVYPPACNRYSSEAARLAGNAPAAGLRTHKHQQAAATAADRK
jgi:hypothetical protein